MNHWFNLILVFNPIDIFIVTCWEPVYRKVGWVVFISICLRNYCHLPPFKQSLNLLSSLDNFDKQKKSLLQRQDLNGENIFTDGEIGKELEQELVNHGANVNYYPFEEVTTLIYCDYPSSAQNKSLSVYPWISRSTQMLEISLSKKESEK